MLTDSDDSAVPQGQETRPKTFEVLSLPPAGSNQNQVEKNPLRFFDMITIPGDGSCFFGACIAQRTKHPLGIKPISEGEVTCNKDQWLSDTEAQLRRRGHAGDPKEYAQFLWGEKLKSDGLRRMLVASIENELVQESCAASQGSQGLDITDTKSDSKVEFAVLLDAYVANGSRIEGLPYRVDNLGQGKTLQNVLEGTRIIHLLRDSTGAKENRTVEQVLQALRTGEEADFVAIQVLQQNIFQRPFVIIDTYGQCQNVGACPDDVKNGSPFFFLFTPPDPNKGETSGHYDALSIKDEYWNNPNFEVRIIENNYPNGMQLRFQYSAPSLEAAPVPESSSSPSTMPAPLPQSAAAPVAKPTITHEASVVTEVEAGKSKDGEEGGSRVNPGSGPKATVEESEDEEDDDDEASDTATAIKKLEILLREQPSDSGAETLVDLPAPIEQALDKCIQYANRSFVDNYIGKLDYLKDMRRTEVVKNNQIVFNVINNAEAQCVKEYRSHAFREVADENYYAGLMWLEDLHGHLMKNLDVAKPDGLNLVEDGENILKKWIEKTLAIVDPLERFKGLENIISAVVSLDDSYKLPMWDEAYNHIVGEMIKAAEALVAMPELAVLDRILKLKDVSKIKEWANYEARINVIKGDIEGQKQSKTEPAASGVAWELSARTPGDQRRRRPSHRTASKPMLITGDENQEDKSHAVSIPQVVAALGKIRNIIEAPYSKRAGSAADFSKDTHYQVINGLLLILNPMGAQERPASEDASAFQGKRQISEISFESMMDNKNFTDRESFLGVVTSCVSKDSSEYGVLNSFWGAVRDASDLRETEKQKKSISSDALERLEAAREHIFGDKTEFDDFLDAFKRAKKFLDDGGIARNLNPEDLKKVSSVFIKISEGKAPYAQALAKADYECLVRGKEGERLQVTLRKALQSNYSDALKEMAKDGLKQEVLNSEKTTPALKFWLEKSDNELYGQLSHLLDNLFSESTKKNTHNDAFKEIFVGLKDSLVASMNYEPGASLEFSLQLKHMCKIHEEGDGLSLENVVNSFANQEDKRNLLEFFKGFRNAVIEESNEFGKSKEKRKQEALVAAQGSKSQLSIFWIENCELLRNDFMDLLNRLIYAQNVENKDFFKHLRLHIDPAFGFYGDFSIFINSLKGYCDKHPVDNASSIESQIRGLSAKSLSSTSDENILYFMIKFRSFLETQRKESMIHEEEPSGLAPEEVLATPDPQPRLAAAFLEAPVRMDYAANGGMKLVSSNVLPVAQYPALDLSQGVTAIHPYDPLDGGGPSALSVVLQFKDPGLKLPEAIQNQLTEWGATDPSKTTVSFTTQDQPWDQGVVPLLRPHSAVIPDAPLAQAGYNQERKVHASLFKVDSSGLISEVETGWGGGPISISAHSSNEGTVSNEIISSPANLGLPEAVYGADSGLYVSVAVGPDKHAYVTYHALLSEADQDKLNEILLNRNFQPTTVAECLVELEKNDVDDERSAPKVVQLFAGIMANVIASVDNRSATDVADLYQNYAIELSGAIRKAEDNLKQDRGHETLSLNDYQKILQRLKQDPVLVGHDVESAKSAWVRRTLDARIDACQQAQQKFDAQQRDNGSLSLKQEHAPAGQTPYEAHKNLGARIRGELKRVEGAKEGSVSWFYAQALKNFQKKQELSELSVWLKDYIDKEQTFEAKIAVWHTLLNAPGEEERPYLSLDISNTLRHDRTATEETFVDSMNESMLKTLAAAYDQEPGEKENTRKSLMDLKVKFDAQTLILWNLNGKDESRQYLSETLDNVAGDIEHDRADHKAFVVKPEPLVVPTTAAGVIALCSREEVPDYDPEGDLNAGNKWWCKWRRVFDTLKETKFKGVIDTVSATDEGTNLHNALADFFRNTHTACENFNPNNMYDKNALSRHIQDLLEIQELLELDVRLVGTDVLAADDSTTLLQGFNLLKAQRQLDKLREDRYALNHDESEDPKALGYSKLLGRSHALMQKLSVDANYPTSNEREVLNELKKGMGEFQREVLTAWREEVLAPFPPAALGDTANPHDYQSTLERHAALESILEDETVQALLSSSEPLECAAVKEVLIHAQQDNLCDYLEAVERLGFENLIKPDSQYFRDLESLYDNHTEKGGLSELLHSMIVEHQAALAAGQKNNNAFNKTYPQRAFEFTLDYHIAQINSVLESDTIPQEKLESLAKLLSIIAGRRLSDIFLEDGKLTLAGYIALETKKLEGQLDNEEQLRDPLRHLENLWEKYTHQGAEDSGVSKDDIRDALNACIKHALTLDYKERLDYLKKMKANDIVKNIGDSYALISSCEEGSVKEYREYILKIQKENTKEADYSKRLKYLEDLHVYLTENKEISCPENLDLSKDREDVLKEWFLEVQGQDVKDPLKKYGKLRVIIDAVEDLNVNYKPQDWDKSDPASTKLNRQKVFHAQGILVRQMIDAAEALWKAPGVDAAPALAGYAACLKKLETILGLSNTEAIPGWTTHEARIEAAKRSTLEAALKAATSIAALEAFEGECRGFSIIQSRGLEQRHAALRFEETLRQVDSAQISEEEKLSALAGCIPTEPKLEREHIFKIFVEEEIERRRKLKSAKSDDNPGFKSDDYDLDLEKFMTALNVSGVFREILLLQKKIEKSREEDFSDGFKKEKAIETIKNLFQICCQLRGCAEDSVKKLDPKMLIPLMKGEDSFEKLCSSYSGSNFQPGSLLYEFNKQALGSIKPKATASGPAAKPEAAPASFSFVKRDDVPAPLPPPAPPKPPRPPLQLPQQDPLIFSHGNHIDRLDKISRKKTPQGLTTENAYEHLKKASDKIKFMSILTEMDDDSIISSMEEERLKRWDNKNERAVRLEHKKNTAKLHENLDADIKTSDESITLSITKSSPESLEVTGSNTQNPVIIIEETFDKKTSATQIKLHSNEDRDILKAVELALQACPSDNRVCVDDITDPIRAMKIYIFAKAAGGDNKFFLSEPTKAIVNDYVNKKCSDETDPKMQALALLYQEIESTKETEIPLAPEKILKKLHAAEKSEKLFTKKDREELEAIALRVELSEHPLVFDMTDPTKAMKISLLAKAAGLDRFSLSDSAKAKASAYADTMIANTETNPKLGALAALYKEIEGGLLRTEEIRERLKQLNGDENPGPSPVHLRV